MGPVQSADNPRYVTYDVTCDALTRWLRRELRQVAGEVVGGHRYPGVHGEVASQGGGCSAHAVGDGERLDAYDGRDP